VAGFSGELLKITLIAVGRLKEPYWRSAQDEYLKRLRPYASIEIREVPDAPDGLGVNEALGREALAIERALPADALVVVLDIGGPTRSSEDNAEWLEQTMARGSSHIALVVGGSNGVAETIRSKADETLSFGPITLPHNLARIVALEQVYRAFKILRGEPYHK